jgi:small subunit ribosomal protein S17
MLKKMIRILTILNEKKKKKIKKRFVGVVVSDKMQKTRVVEVVRIFKHPLYKKYIRVKRKFKAHDEKNKTKVGDKVIIQETRPISKEKHFVIVKVL